MPPFLTPLRGGTSRFQGSIAGPSQSGALPSRQLDETTNAITRTAEFWGEQGDRFRAFEAAQQEKLAILQEKKREALEASTAAKRIAIANEQLSQLRFQLPNDPSIHPLERREKFVQQTNALLAQVGNGLTEVNANEAYAHLQSKATMLANSLDQEGTQAFIKQETDSLEAELHVYSREFVHAETPGEQQLTLSNVALSLTKRVEAGIITEAQRDQMTQDFVDNANSIAVETAINNDPEGFFDHLDSLISGGPGTPGMPVPADLNKAFQLAQNEIREVNGFADRQEARAEKFESEAQDARAFAVYGEALESRRDAGKLSQLFNQVRELGKSEAISPSQAGQIAKSITGMLDELATGGVSDNVDVIRQARRLADFDPDLATKFVRENEGTGLKFGTVNTLLSQFNNMKQEGHISRHPQVRAAEDAISGAFSSNSMFADMVDAATLNRVKTEAIDDFRQRMYTLAGPQGTVVGPALDALPDIQEKVVEAYRKQFASFTPGSELSAAPPIARSVPDLIHTAMRAINNGASQPQVEGWVRKDLIRLYIAQGGAPEDMVAFDAWAAQVLQELRGRGEGGTPKQ